MRILHVIRSVAPQEGGPSFVLRQLVDGLAAEGLEVHVASTIGSGETVEDMATMGSAGKFWFFPRQGAFYSVSWPLHRWLAVNIGEYSLVHIHSLFSFACTSAAYWSRQRGVPYVVRPLGTLNRWGFQNRRPWLKKVSLRCIESGILRHAAAVHYTTEEEQVEAERLGVPQRAVVIPNPYQLPSAQVDVRSFRSRFPVLADKVIVLFLSRIHRKKGLDLLLPAFAELHRRYPGTALLIGGDGDAGLVAELRRKADALGIADEIVWAGFLDGKEKLEALLSSAVFVLPSYSENFGVAVIEAMAAGLPVVVSDQVAVEKEVKASRAGIVCSCSAESVTAALCRILADPAAGSRMGQNGATFVRDRYSIPVVTAHLLKVYDSILGSGAAAMASRSTQRMRSV